MNKESATATVVSAFDGFIKVVAVVSLDHINSLLATIVGVLSIASLIFRLRSQVKGGKDPKDT